MEKGMEFFDSWVKSQKDFLENWVKSQREFLEQWTEATKKMQESFLSAGGSQEGSGKEFSAIYSSWVNTMVNSTKTFTDEAIKIQETWKNNVEKQMEMSREMFKNLTQLFPQATQKK